MIRYQSLSMPVMVLPETNTDDKDEKINVDCDDDRNTNTSSEVTLIKNERYILGVIRVYEQRHDN